MKNTMFQLLCGLAMLSMSTVAMAQDDHGDTKDEATVITVNAEATAGKIDPDTDSDWFSFSADAGTPYTITVVLGTLVNASTFIFDPNGANPEEIENDGVEWIAPSSDTYYVRITSEKALYIGTYEISITTEQEIDAGLDGGVDGGDWGWTEEETITGGTGECSCRAVGRSASPLGLLSLLAMLFV